MDNQSEEKKETKLRRLSRLMWRVFVLEWCIAMLVVGYLLLVSSLHEDLQSKVLACSDIEDFAKLPKKYQKLCPKGEPKNE